MDEGRSQLDDFAAHRLPGESVLAWASADEGSVVLTEKRLCLCAGGELRSLAVNGPNLRYRPLQREYALLALFESDSSTLEFTVGHGEQAQLGTLLGNIAELREAHALLEEAGLDPAFVSRTEDGSDGLSGIYQLMRLKELANQGLLGDFELMLERERMLERLRAEGAARS